jgi:hypothetical protein
MVEKSEKLKAALTELHAELEQVDTVDPELRQMLVGTMSDINKALEARSSEEAVEQEDSLSGRLAESIKDFEESHPNIAGIVQRMIDVLSQMGI